MIKLKPMAQDELLSVYGVWVRNSQGNFLGPIKDLMHSSTKRLLLTVSLIYSG